MPLILNDLKSVSLHLTWGLMFGKYLFSYRSSIEGRCQKLSNANGKPSASCRESRRPAAAALCDCPPVIALVRACVTRPRVGG